MIHLRRSSQYSFGEGLVAEQTGELREPWMRQADKVLEDEQLINAVYQGLLKRHAKSRTRGRLGVPAEIVLRMLLLKHIRNWSFAVVEREVRANLVYREFTRVGAAKAPDARTLGRQARALGPEVVKQIHERMVALAVENKLVQGRRMRVDTTVVETNNRRSFLRGAAMGLVGAELAAIGSADAQSGTIVADCFFHNVPFLLVNHFCRIHRLICGHRDRDVDVASCSERIRTHLLCPFHQRLGRLVVDTRQADIETGCQTMNAMR